MGKLSDALRRAEEERRRRRAKADEQTAVPPVAPAPVEEASVTLADTDVPIHRDPAASDAADPKGPAVVEAVPAAPAVDVRQPSPAVSVGQPSPAASMGQPPPAVDVGEGATGGLSASAKEHDTGGQAARGTQAPRRDVGPPLRLPTGRATRQPHPRLVCYYNRHDIVAELFQQLRTRLLALNREAGSPKVVVVTSTAPGEGKTLTCANLGVSMAGYVAGPVLAVDGDLRKSQLHEILAVNRAPGLSDVLAGRVALSDAIQASCVQKLYVLAAGREVDNPTALLGSERAEAAMAQLRATFTYVIIDSPPVMTVTDASVLGAHADGAVVIVRAGRTDREAVARAVDVLASAGVEVLGTVLNRLRQPTRRGYRYRYYHV